MLSELRALDLTNESGFFCGKLLAEFGVEVIKIEPPGGDHARHYGPFYHDTIDPEKSLYWFAFNDSKKSITLNIETPEGQEIFRQLTQKADFVIESFRPGYLKKFGLDYPALSNINPAIIMTAISPFGQTGPYRDYKSTDLIAMAMGGIMSLTGKPDGVPCRLNPNHAYCLGGAYAAVASMTAYYYRQRTGEGQYIDVSLFESVVRENYSEVPVAWKVNRHTAGRHGDIMFRYGVNTRTIWPCKDGHVTWTLFGGTIGAMENKQLAKWLDEENLLGDLKNIDWDKWGFDGITQTEIDRIEKPVFQLLMKYTKKEIEDESMKRGLRISAVSDVKDLTESAQLNFRHYWKELEHPELGESIKYPGHLYQSNQVNAEPRFRAPLMGEHNKTIYEVELGLDSKTMVRLKDKGVI
jgi:benzylsuccinate CoA-transferase BbsE subunit